MSFSFFEIFLIAEKNVVNINVLQKVWQNTGELLKSEVGFLYKLRWFGWKEW